MTDQRHDGTLQRGAPRVTLWRAGPAPDARPQPVADDRIQSLDVLRGVALFGILLVNMRHFASPAMYQSGAQVPTVGTTLDHWVNGFVQLFAMGKFFPLFSFLFGLGLAIQLLSWESKGISSTRLFVRRLSFLLLIGLGHATFIWAGDILAKYATLGLLFLVVLSYPPKYLLVGAGFFLMMPFLLGWLGFDAYLAMVAGLPKNPGEFQMLMQHSLAAYGGGSFLEMTQQRLVDYAYRLTAWTYVSGLFTILCMFSLGAYAGRQGLFKAPRGERFRKYLVVAVCAWFACLAAYAGTQLVPALAIPQLMKVHQLAWNLSTTAVYISTIVLLVEQNWLRSRLAPLASTGRMALTNYLLQSVLATSIFYGLGYYGQLGATACLGITIGIFALQVVVSNIWLQRFRFGPVEWLWRWVTYGKRPPMKREAPREADLTHAA